MKRIFLKVGILWFGLWGSVAWAQGQQSVPSIPLTQAMSVVSPTPTVLSVPSPTSAPTVRATVAPMPEGPHLKDKFALGTDILRIDENSPQPGSGIAAASLSALDAIWWISDVSGIDFLATVSTSQNPNVDFNGNNYTYNSEVFGGGLGYRANLSSPTKNLKIQGLLRATYGRYTNQQQLWYYQPTNISFETGTVNSETFNFIAGLGFEYFMPFCESLSIQSYISFAATYSQNNGTITYNPAMSNYGYYNYINSAYQSSYWRTALSINGLSLSTLAVHFYF